MAPDLVWSGPSPGPGDCLNRREAIAMIEQRRSQDAIGELKELVPIDEDRVIVVLDAAGSAGLDEAANLVTFRDGRVVSMRGYSTRDAALAAAAEPSMVPERRDAGEVRAGAAERAEALIPFVHVADPERSVAFYETLGFELADT